MGQEAPATTATWSAMFEEQVSSLGTAGDVNGDGVDDIIVGVSAWSDPAWDWEGRAGRAFVFMGHCGEEPSATPDWFAQGARWFDDTSGDPGQHRWVGGELGWQVGAAGDVDGDGFDDVFAFEPEWTESEGDHEHPSCDPLDGACPAGRVHVWHGGPDGLPGAGSGLPAPPATWIWSGSDVLDHRHHVAAAGDVNGDGFGDLIIGSPSCCREGLVAGRVRVFHGSAGGLLATPSTVIDGTDILASHLGRVVSAAGDVNGDGFGDVLVAESGYRPGPFGLEPVDRVHLLAGSGSGILQEPVWTIEGLHPESGLGTGLAALGDIHGDGFDDFLVTELLLSPAARIYAGAATWPAAVPQSNHAAPSSGDRPAGPAGDVNADGFADVLVSHAFDQVVRVLHGGASGLSAGPVLEEASPEYEWFGYGSPTWTAGDVNSDGASDVLVAQFGWAPACGLPCLGKVWLYPGVGPPPPPPEPGEEPEPPCPPRRILFVSDGPPEWNDITDDFVPKGCGPVPGEPCPSAWIVTRGPAPWSTNGVRARFTLDEVSSHPGIAMNRDRPDRDPNEPDLVFEAGAGCAEPNPIATCTVPYVADPERGRSLAATRVVVTDWAARAIVTGMRLDPAPAERPLPRLRVPVDTNDNCLPDAGWTTWSLLGPGLVSPEDQLLLSQGGDFDNRPSSNYQGDGLTDFEEYRGFFIMGEHRRTHPRTKDLFVGNVPGELALQSLMKLELALHEVTEGDVRPESMRINHFATPGWLGSPQYAVFRVDDECPCEHEEAAFGCVVGRDPNNDTTMMDDMSVACEGLATPRTAFRVYLNPDRIRERTPPRLDPATIDALDESAARKTYLHELGHAIGMDHFGYLDGPSGGFLRDGSCFPAYTNLCPVTSEASPPECGPSSVMVRWFDWARMDCRPRERTLRDPDAPPGLPPGPRDDCVYDAPCPAVNPAIPTPYWVNMPLRTHGPFGRDHQTYDAIDKSMLKLK